MFQFMIRNRASARAFGAMVAACFCLAATLADAAGFQRIDVPADANGPALKGGVWYPCASPPGPIDLGSTVLQGVQNCPVLGEKLPLILISHGSGGSFVGHHDTAEALADAGFVVAALNHPGDNSRDKERRGYLAVFVSRPLDMKRLLDAMLGVWPDHAKIDADRIGFFGFSRGGYTGMVLIGANPDFRKGAAFCAQIPDAPLCEQIRTGDIPAGPLTHDPRIKAAVLADTLSFFSAESLADIKTPIQLWGSEFGGDGVTPESVAAIDHDLPTKHEYHLVHGAAHYAFLAPCAPALAKAAPEICVDAAGFDRAAFHKEFNASLLAFFRQHLVEPQ
jgi:predicted dienelactone hydrolase